MILVTGGAGFIGSAVVRRLLHDGHAVRVVDDLSKGKASNVPDGPEQHTGDLTDPDVARAAFRDVDVCFHLAAKIGGIAYFHRYPADILDENNLMLSSVFRAALGAGTKVVYVSSSMVFERATEFPTPEDAIDRTPSPFSAYGFSKLVGEWYARAFHEQHGLPYAIARPFNAYGPGELPENEPGLAHVIPDLIRKILDGGTSIEIFGGGNQVRSFTYVEDVADAIVTIGVHPDAQGQDFNIGTGVETSVRELLDMLLELCEQGPREIVRKDPLPVDVVRRVPDVTKIRTRLGWEAKVPLEEGLRRTIDWYRSANPPGLSVSGT
jgi:UDP-glucose 4-epimerase